MNGRLRLFLCGACAAIGAFHAPASTQVLVQDLLGPYGAELGVSSRGVESLVSIPKPIRRVDAEGSDDEGAERVAYRR